MWIEDWNNSNLENGQGQLSDNLKGQSALSKHFEESADRFTKKTLKKTNDIIWNSESSKDLVTINTDFIIKFKEAWSQIQTREALIITQEVVDNYLTKGETITPFELYTYFQNIVQDFHNFKYQWWKNAWKTISNTLQSLSIDVEKIDAVILEIVRETFWEDAFNNTPYLKLLYEQNLDKNIERTTELISKNLQEENEINPFDGLVHSVDSIDNNLDNPKAKKHTYTQEESQKYLDELNEEYPIQEVFWEYLNKYMLSDENLRGLFNYSFAQEAWFERELFMMVKESFRAHKWVSKKSIKLSSVSLQDLEDGKIWNIGIDNSMEYNAVWFYNNNEVTGLKDKALSFMGIKESSEDIYMFPKENMIYFIMNKINLQAKAERNIRVQKSEIQEVLDKIQPQGHKGLSLPILKFIIEGYRNFENNSKQSIKKFVYEQIKDGSESIPQLEVLGQSILEVFDNMIKHWYIKGVWNETKLDLRFNDEKLNVYFWLDLINEWEETKLKIV